MGFNYQWCDSIGFAGVKEGMFGIEALTRNPDEVLIDMPKNEAEIIGTDGEPI
ncbi:hypothetical protein [Proteus sp. CD3]|uniref:hypothetical protein n=1 Tax=Proteus sp. CD3 TaxID=1921565 RepID=UPI0022402CB6|nr:hypothetical protein [Proteus sp. CD3]